MSRPSPQISGQPNRLSKGGGVDRGQCLSFTFDGKSFEGYAGDTLASALIAAGAKLFGRSFKYHRPRGLLTAGPEEPNALVELRAGARREPNNRATVVELFAGLEARSQNRWPSLAFDLGAVNSLLAPMLVAGFYYKTFMRPAALWERLYEPAIRRAAGLGRPNFERDPDHYEKGNAFCDVLVVGGGPGGLSAALTAGRAGARVILCDEDFLLGGRLNGDRREIDGLSGSQWARHVETELASMPDVRVLRRTTVFGRYDGGTYGAVERVADHMPIPMPRQPRQRMWRIVAKRTVLAAGAIERPIVFENNDRPGVMLASAVRTYVNRFGVTPGRRVVVFTTTDDGWQTALHLFSVGVPVEAIVDTRSEVEPALLDMASRVESRVLLGSHVDGIGGSRATRYATVQTNTGRREKIAADTLAVSGGWTPNIALSTHLGTRAVWSEEAAAFIPGGRLAGMTVVGACRGSYRLADALREGNAAGAEAVEALGFRALRNSPGKADDESIGLKGFWHRSGNSDKAFVDFQHDVTRRDLEIAAREGFTSVELLKRYTTLGMATDQGKTSNVNGHAIMAELTGRPIQELGTTVLRPPYTPVSLGVLAGHHRGKEFRPTRLTPTHRWACERGASFVEAGQWLRAQWYAIAGEKDWMETVSREVQSVRSSVGVCDVSTLGKIDIQGTDAATFLDRVYINTFSTLPVGKARYGVLLRQDGIVFDDGTTARLAPGHYLMSTTTANAAGVMQHLEYARQVLWPQLDVQLVSVTEHWAQYAIAGPNARRLMERLLCNVIELSNEAFPYLACAEFSWSGIGARLFRVSFSGELAYEFAVPARYGDAAIRAIMVAGEEWNVTPYGTEALGVMRVEKGHVAGNELNGTTTASDLGLGRLMSSQKDFIGRMMAQREGLTHPNRPVLVGVRPVDPRARFHAGAHFIDLGAPASPENDAGYLTSVAYSPMLRGWIGIGLLARGRQRLGEIIRAYDPLRGTDIEVEVVPPAFFDPEGVRVRS